MKVIDMDDVNEDRFLKALVYGGSGTGKTNFGVSAPKPIILLSEQQAVPHIRAAALRLGRPNPPVLVMESLDDYRCALTALRGDKAKPFVVRDLDGKEVMTLAEWPETAVLDSVTDACELVSQEIRTQSPPKTGKDGLPVDSERYWNVLADRAQKLIRAFRDLPMNVLFLCLLDERITEDEDGKKSKWVGPQLAMRKMPGVIQAAVNVVGVTYRRRAKVADKQGNRPNEYGIATIGPDYFQLKPFPPLRDHEVTDFSSWCARINGVDDGSKAPDPMDSDASPNTAGDVTAPAKVIDAAQDVAGIGPAVDALAGTSSTPAVDFGKRPKNKKPSEPVGSVNPPDATTKVEVQS